MPIKCRGFASGRSTSADRSLLDAALVRAVRGIPARLSRLRADSRIVRRAFPLLARYEGALQLTAQSSIRLSPSNFR